MMLQVNDLSVNRGGRNIVTNVSFSVNENDWLMLVGPNGAGKSTVLRAISCTTPSSGRILLNGVDLRRMKPTERALHMGMLEAGSSSAYAFTVQQIVSMGRYAHRKSFSGKGDADGEARIEEALQQTGMTELRHHSMLSLSSGERQRAFLAQVLCQEPSLLLLDEPESHLDLSYTRQLYALIDNWRRQPSHAVISVVHDLSAAKRFGTCALLLDHGVCKNFGSMEQVLTDDHIAQAWGTDAAEWLRQLASVWR